jgi:hypothetical protein
MLSAVEMRRNVQISTLYGAFCVVQNPLTHLKLTRLKRSQQQPNHNHNSNDFPDDDGHKLTLPSQLPSFHHLSFFKTFPFTMGPMSSRSRAILEFDLEVPLFVNWMAPSKNSLKPTTQLHSIEKLKVRFISGMVVEEESAGQTVPTGRAIILKFWGHADVRKPLIVASIDIPNKWTSRMYLCLLHEAVLESGIISLEIKLASCKASNVGRIRYEKYKEDCKVLEEAVFRWTSYSRVRGGGTGLLVLESKI